MSDRLTRSEAPPDETERDAVLNDIAAKWSRFSKRELAALETTEDVVAQVTAKYGVDQTAAQRDVDRLLQGRHLTP